RAGVAEDPRARRPPREPSAGDPQRAGARLCPGLGSRRQGDRLRRRDPLGRAARPAIPRRQGRGRGRGSAQAQTEARRLVAGRAVVRRLVQAAALLLALATPAAADDAVTLEGVLSQGGFARGEAPPGTTLALDGRAVRVAPDGKFILGFGRDAPAKV